MLTKTIQELKSRAQSLTDWVQEARVVRAALRVTDELAQTVQKPVQGTLAWIRIPTREQIRAFERRISRLEKQLKELSRAPIPAKRSASPKQPTRRRATVRKTGSSPAPQPTERAVTTQRRVTEPVREWKAPATAPTERPVTPVPPEPIVSKMPAVEPIRPEVPAEDDDLPAAVSHSES